MIKENLSKLLNTLPEYDILILLRYEWLMKIPASNQLLQEQQIH